MTASSPFLSIDPTDSPAGLERVAFFGRRLRDYAAFFGFEPGDLAGRKVADIAAGSASFAAEASASALQVQAIDPCYRLRPEGIRDRAARDFERMRRFIEDHPERFPSHSVAKLLRIRREAMERFLADYPAGIATGRYRAGCLPRLDLDSRSFDDVFCGHFLFLYHHLLSPSFHFDAIRELLRIARERVVIYPLVTLEGKPYPPFDSLLKDLAPFAGIQLQRVAKPTFRNANERLILRPR